MLTELSIYGTLDEGVDIMPRTARKKSETGIYHIMLRGINKQVLFEDEEDCEKFLQVLKECRWISGYKLMAYCLMGNHLHLLMKEEKEELEQIFKRIGVRYVYWYNFKYKRSGHLFQDRFKSEPINSDGYFLAVLRYIHQNPVKAGLCNDVSEYKWSSYCDYMNDSGITDIEFGLSLFNKDKKRATLEFKKYMKEYDKTSCPNMEQKNLRKKGKYVT